MSVNVYNKNGDTLTKLAGNIGVANNNRLGIIKPDGSTITIDADGTLHGSTQISTATAEIAGVVKPDGTTIVIDENGVISSVGGGGTANVTEISNDEIDSIFTS